MSGKADANSATSWVWLALFIGVIAALGGSSRADVVQVAALRPLAALFLIPALYYLRLEHLREAKGPVLLLALFALWMTIQLVPLPPAMWQSLPGREVISDLDALHGLAGEWRPISWVPSRGWNALASLVVPITALLLALAMRASPRMLLLLIAGLALADALIGLLQVISGRGSPLYLYAVTNRGLPVGVFANENHSALLSAIGLLVIARLGASSKQMKEPIWLRFSYPPAFLLVLLAALVSGSRAGLVMSALALLGSMMIFWLSMTASRKHKRQGKMERWVSQHPRILLLIFAGVIIALVAAFFGLERAPGFEDILAQNAFEDLRWQLWPTLEQMIGTFWLFGIGSGSFEEFYHIYEPSSLLFPSYVNQAHNDWAQLVIEGGLPALGLIAALLIWAAWSLLGLLLRSDDSLAGLIFWGAIFAILCAASIVDYPLRTAIFQLIGTWLALVLALESTKVRKSHGQKAVAI